MSRKNRTAPLHFFIDLDVKKLIKKKRQKEILMKITTLFKNFVVFSLFVFGILFFWTTAAATQIKKPQNRSIFVRYVPNPPVPNYYNNNFNIDFSLNAGLSEEIYEIDSLTVECLATTFNSPKHTFNFTNAVKIFLQNGNITETPRRSFKFKVRLTVRINNTNNDIELTANANGVVLTANWTQLPINLEFTARAAGRFKTLHIDAAFNEKETMVFSVNPQGRGTAPTPTTPPAGGIPGVVELDDSGRLFLPQCNNKTIATNIAPGGFKATMTGSGPLIIYQSGNIVYYAMYTIISSYDSPGFDCTRVANGSVGNGQLVNVDFQPARFGAIATIAVRNQRDTVYYVFNIDRWGAPEFGGNTKQVGTPLTTRLPHWLVQWRSTIYLYEFDAALGRLTCSSNYKRWKQTVASGNFGLIVPTSTGGGPVVVYEMNRTVYANMLKWDTGGKIKSINLGTGTLLGVNYTKRGSYGARGTATIRTNPLKQVRFCIDMWGDKGCNRILQSDTAPSGTPIPPNPPPGFPGGGVNPNPPAGLPGGGVSPGGAPDTDGDGFSDTYETDAGTDPTDPNSKPDIDMSILLLIDKSGSMNNNNKMENAKKAAIQALSKIDKKTEIAVMSYSGGCSETFPVVANFSQNPAYLTQQIQTIQAGGGTPMSPAMLQANSYLRNQGHGKSGLIILLCDGQNDCPPNEVDAAKQIFTRQVPVKITSLQISFPSQNRTKTPLLAVTMAGAAARLQAQPQTQPGTGEADSIPQGITTPPDIVPIEIFPLTPGMGSVNTVPAGQPEPTDLQQFIEAPLFGSIGLDTTIPPSPEARSNIGMPIAISTIGFGLQNDPQAQSALAAVSQAGGGQSYDAQNLSQLTTAFSQAIAQAPTTGGGGVAYSKGAFPEWAWLLIIFSGVFLMIIAIAVVVIRRKNVPPAPAGVSLANLDIYYNDGTSTRIPLKSTQITIGHESTCDVVLADSSSSGKHAEITITDQGYLLRDLGSSNGTFVNGKQISEAYIHSGDTIIMGSTQLILR